MFQRSKVQSNHLEVRIRVLVGCLILAFVSGCASDKLIVKNLDSDSKVSTNSRNSIVVGSIEVRGYEGIGIPVGRFFTLIEIPSLRSAGVSFSNGEPFYLLLEPGEYQIVGIYKRVGLTGLMGQGQGPQNPTVNMRFAVKENEVIYIGKLALRPRGHSYDVTVLDEYELANTRLQREFPNLQEPLKKSLMH